MNTTKKILFGLFLLVVANSLLAAENPEYKMKIYTVPTESQTELISVLRKVIPPTKYVNSNGGYRNEKAAVEPLGDTQIAITTTEEIHKDVAKLISAIKPTPIVSIEMEYWVVRGTPMDSTTISDDLTGVESALMSIVNSKGDMEFTLLDYVQMHTTSSRQSGSSEYSSNTTHIEQELALRGDTLVGEIEIHQESTQSSLETQVAIETGKFIVLGQITINNIDFNDFEGLSSSELAEDGMAQRSNIFYIIKATIN